MTSGISGGPDSAAELRRLGAEIDDQIDAFRARIRRAAAEADAETHRAASSDGQAVAVVSADGRQVLDLRLTRGFGDLNRPAWALADDVDAVCRAIVDAVNRARRAATETNVEKLREEFPDAFDLLTDIQPDHYSEGNERP